MKRQVGMHEPPAAARAAESRAWTDALVRALIRHAAHRAPPDLSERLEEEWFADLATRRGPLARLLFAAGCRWAARTIALEFGAPARVAVAAAGSQSVAACDRPSPPSGSPRLIFFFTQPQQPLAVPQPSRLALADPTVDVPTPLFTLDLPADSGTRIVVSETSASAPQSPPPAARAIHRVVGGPGAGFPNTEDFYPANARRLGVEGATDVRVCVDAAGRLTAAPVLAQSSGSALLDDGALSLARAASGHYRATTEDGRAVSSCYPFRIRFRMQH
jgi:TonB family protein